MILFTPSLSEVVSYVEQSHKSVSVFLYELSEVLSPHEQEIWERSCFLVIIWIRKVFSLFFGQNKYFLYTFSKTSCFQVLYWDNRKLFFRCPVIETRFKFWTRLRNSWTVQWDLSKFLKIISHYRRHQ